MNLRVCNCCGKDLTNAISSYNLYVNYKEKQYYHNNVDAFDLCPECYDKLIKSVKQFQYGTDTPGEGGVEGTLTQNFITQNEFFALQVLFNKYFRRKTKLRKLFNNFLLIADERIAHEVTEDQIDNIADIVERWEKEL